ncbi:MAG: protease modulator HflC [Alphaproteobacteria bacterium]
MNRQVTAVLVAVLVAVVIVANTFFSVSETEQAVVLQFGKPVEEITVAGLKIKAPVLQNVLKFDRRILSTEKDSIDVPDRNRQRLLVDAFVRYRIVKPLLFYQTQPGEERLKSFLESATRNVIAQTTIVAVLSQERDAVMGEIQRQVSSQFEQFGIKVVDVRIRRTDLPEQNRDSIINRMVAERQQEASKLRAEGDQIYASIKAEADREVTVIRADANRKAQITMGEGDAERNRIYAEAFSKDPDFFAFYRSMDAYKKALGQADTTMVLSPTSEFFRYLGSDRGK